MVHTKNFCFYVIFVVIKIHVCVNKELINETNK